MRGAALRRLAELAPSEGRTAIMAELRRPLPRVPTAALLHLPDRTLPALERIWIGQLERATTDEQPRERGTTDSAVRHSLERPAGRAVLCSNRRTLPSAAKAAILAHLSRVNPAAPRKALREASVALAGPKATWETLLEYVASLTWQPEIERAAIEALSGSDPNDVERAARLLSRHGTPEAREPIRARLRRSQAVLLRQEDRTTCIATGRIAPNGTSKKSWRVALAHARGWLLADDAAAAEAAQCVTPTVRRRSPEDRDADPEIEVEAYGPVPGDERHIRFVIGQMDYDSIEELERKLTQFAPGTRLYWDVPAPLSRSEDSLERWTWSERNALFERVRASAARHGVTIQRERTYKR